MVNTGTPDNSETEPDTINDTSGGLTFDQQQSQQTMLNNSGGLTFDQQQSQQTMLNTSNPIQSEARSHNREHTTQHDPHNRERLRLDPSKLPVLDPTSISNKSFSQWVRDFEDQARLPPYFGGLGSHINNILVSNLTPTFGDYSYHNNSLLALLAYCLQGSC
jgi:hypothetical protein